MKTTKPGNPKKCKAKERWRESHHKIKLLKTSDNEIILKAVKGGKRHIINKGKKVKMWTDISSKISHMREGGGRGDRDGEYM